MKRFSIIVLLLVLVAVTSCNNQNSPKEVATKWLTSFYHIDYDAAKGLSTDETKVFLSSLQQFASIVPDSSKQSLKNISVKIKDVQQKGDTANAVYTTSDNPGKEQNIMLVKQNGKWLVAFSKNDNMDAVEEPAASDAATGSDSTGAAPGEAPSQDSAAH